MNKFLKWILGITAALILLAGFAAIVWNASALYNSPAATEPTTQPAATEATTTENATSTSNSQIMVDGKDVGVLLDNGAVAITNGRVFFQHDAPYSDEELAKIQSTPVTYTVTIRNNGTAVAFGYKVGTYDKGVIMHVTTTSVTILDGELVIWPSFDLMMADVSTRIPDEIQNGNADFSKLSFHWISKDFRGYVNDNLISANGVQIIP